MGISRRGRRRSANAGVACLPAAFTAAKNAPASWNLRFFREYMQKQAIFPNIPAAHN
jgi:hypothetical protein